VPALSSIEKTSSARGILIAFRENAVKQTPTGTLIEIGASASEDQATMGPLDV